MSPPVLATHPPVFFGILVGNFIRRFSFSLQGGLRLFYEYAPGSFGWSFLGKHTDHMQQHAIHACSFTSWDGGFAHCLMCRYPEEGFCPSCCSRIIMRENTMIILFYRLIPGGWTSSQHRLHFTNSVRLEEGCCFSRVNYLGWGFCTVRAFFVQLFGPLHGYPPLPTRLYVWKRGKGVQCIENRVVRSRIFFSLIWKIFPPWWLKRIPQLHK